MNERTEKRIFIGLFIGVVALLILTTINLNKVPCWKETCKETNNQADQWKTYSITWQVYKLEKTLETVVHIKDSGLYNNLAEDEISKSFKSDMLEIVGETSMGKKTVYGTLKIYDSNGKLIEELAKGEKPNWAK